MIDNLPAPRDDWGYDDYVRAWRELESRSAWWKGDLACAVETSYGEHTLERYAKDTGTEYSTMRDYKRVAKAYPAESVDRSTNHWTVFRVLTDQPDRLELVASRDDWTVAQARELVQARAQPKIVQPREPEAQAELRALMDKHEMAPAEREAALAESQAQFAEQQRQAAAENRAHLEALEKQAQQRAGSLTPVIQEIARHLDAIAEGAARLITVDKGKSPLDSNTWKSTTPARHRKQALLLAQALNDAADDLISLAKVAERAAH